MNIELPDFLLEMSKQMSEQPNRCTAHPFWQVRCKRYIVTAEGYNQHHWELHEDDGEGYPVFSTQPHFDNAASTEDFDEKNKAWCSGWIEENIDAECVGEDTSFFDLFDFQRHQETCEDWPEGYRVIHLQEVEEVVTTHLTEVGALAFIKRKQHDYPELYTYVESAYWSPQLRELQDWIIRLTND